MFIYMYIIIILLNHASSVVRVISLLDTKGYKFDETKVITRSYKSPKDRQYNDQQNTKLHIEQHELLYT